MKNNITETEVVDFLKAQANQTAAILGEQYRTAAIEVTLNHDAEEVSCRVYTSDLSSHRAATFAEAQKLAVASQRNALATRLAQLKTEAERITKLMEVLP